MRAKEFITESAIIGSILPDVERTLPAAWVIDKLKNSDFYMQYRFGVSFAGAKGREQREKDNVPDFATETPWGENQVVVSFAGKEPTQQYLNDALQQMGLKPSDAKLVTTPKSQEPSDTVIKSPLSSFKGYPR